jgi:hypothetical protein
MGGGGVGVAERGAVGAGARDAIARRRRGGARASQRPAAGARRRAPASRSRSRGTNQREPTELVRAVRGRLFNEAVCWRAGGRWREGRRFATSQCTQGGEVYMSMHGRHVPVEGGVENDVGCGRGGFVYGEGRGARLDKPTNAAGQVPGRIVITLDNRLWACWILRRCV